MPSQITTSLIQKPMGIRSWHKDGFYPLSKKASEIELPAGFLKCGQASKLGLEGTSAAAALCCVGVFEGEALLFEAFIPIDGGTI